ncbi:MAG: LysE/ArgO family amino acid transporter [Desulfovibrionaceae bacterium]
MSALLQGFGLGCGLIVAIGAQNAFVLTRGARRDHPWLAALCCSACDAVLIALGVAGVGGVAAASRTLTGLATWGGAAFLAWYGLRAGRSALRPSALATTGAPGPAMPRPARAVILTALAVSWLNPHAWLDTVVLLGGISAHHAGAGRWWFGLGAALASLVWFHALGLGGRLLAPVLAGPRAWRVLDAVVCLTMLSIAASLVREGLRLGLG